MDAELGIGIFHPRIMPISFGQSWAGLTFPCKTVKEVRIQVMVMAMATSLLLLDRQTFCITR